MMLAQHLSFAATPLSIFMSVAAVVTAALLGFMAWRRSGFANSIGLLELARLVIVSLVAVLLNQPEWIEEYRPEHRPRVAVMFDDSASMDTVDAVPATPSNAQGTATAISRAEAIRPWTDPDSWSRLKGQLDVTIESLDGPSQRRQADADTFPSQLETAARSARTNLAAPLMDLADNAQQLLGVVLISDGDWNEGPPPVEAASRLRMRGVPIFTVTTGSTSRLPDLELFSADVPTFAAAGKTVRIPIAIDSSLQREVSATVSLRVSEQETITKEIRVAPMSRTFESLTWKPPTVGDYSLEISIPVDPQETIATNNQVSAPISIRQEQLKVLIVESTPRWEYRYLRNALSRDPGVEVSCLLFHPGLEKVGGGSQDYIKRFPEEMGELARFDVVFLGDVGLDDGQLTEAQCELLKGLVEHQASGLILMPGLQGRQFSLLDTELGELFPVVMDPTQPDGWGSRESGHFELSERGRSSLLTRLADSAEENMQVWDDLPGFQWYAPVLRSKAGSEVLAVHNEMSNQYGRLPLLVTRTFGAGKVLFMGTDGAWRWRKGVEDKYHYRFWGQVVRWMAYQRNMAKGETMRLYHTPDQPDLRQSMTFSAHVMDSGGEPLQQGDVVAHIVAPGGGSETVRLVSDGDRWGVFQGRFTPREPGPHRVLLTCEQTSATLQTNFFVQGQLGEPIGKPARPDVMQELATVSRGRAVQSDQINDVLDSLADLPMPPPSIRRLQLWSHPLCGVVLVVLLGGFWIWRKSVGLV